MSDSGQVDSDFDTYINLVPIALGIILFIVLLVTLSKRRKRIQAQKMMAGQELDPETLRPISQGPLRAGQPTISRPIPLSPMSSADDPLGIEAIGENRASPWESGRFLPPYTLPSSSSAVGPVPDVAVVDTIMIAIDPEREAQDQSQEQPPLYEN